MLQNMNILVMSFSAYASHVRCFVSSSRVLIGDKSRGQVKRLALMSLEVMGRVAAVRALWRSGGKHRLQKLDRLSRQAT
jgi:hypothetical protein